MSSNIADPSLEPANFQLNDFTRSLIEYSLDGIVGFDLDLKYTVWNSSMEEFSGLKKQSVIGKSIYDLIPLAKERGIDQFFIAALNGEIKRVTGKFNVAGKNLIEYESTYYPIRNSSQEISGGIVIVRDLTKLIEAQSKIKTNNELLIETNQKLEVTQKLAKIGYWERNLITGETFWQKFLKEEIFELEQSYESSFSNFISLVHPEDKEQLITKVSQIQSGISYDNTFQYRLISGKGNLKYIAGINIPVKNERGEVYKIRGYAQDVTHLKKNEIILQTVLEKSFNGISYLKPVFNNKSIVDFEIIFANQKLAEFLNLGLEFILGKKMFSEIITHTNVPIYQRYISVYNSGNPIHEIIYSKHFNKWFSTNVCKIDNGLLVNSEDITELKIKEEELKTFNKKLEQNVLERTEQLKQETDKFKSLAEAIPQLVFISSNSKSEYLNNRWVDYFGDIDFDNKWNELLHPDDIEPSNEAWNEAIVNKTNFNFEYRLRRKDGVFEWFTVKAIPIKDNEGNILKWFGTCTEIQRIKEIEQSLILKNQELMRINNDMDNFIYTASHDLKAPVSNIEGLIYTLSDFLPEESQNFKEVDAILKMMKGSIVKFKNTINELSEVTKISKEGNMIDPNVNFEELSHEICETTIKELIRTNEAEIQFNFQVSHINFSKKNLRSVLYNLISNAIKYRNPKTKPIVVVTTKQVSVNEIVLSVSDNGLGLTKLDQAKLFQMFKRLHQHVEGSGIGLYLVKKILDNAGGRIEVESELNQGTTFNLYFKSQAN